MADGTTANGEKKGPGGAAIAGFVLGGIALLLIGLALGWYLFYRVIYNQPVQPAPPPAPPAAARPDPAAVAALETALDRQRKSNKDLEDQIAKLRGALQGDVCTIVDPRGLGIPGAPAGGPGSTTMVPGGTSVPGGPAGKGATSTPGGTGGPGATGGPGTTPGGTPGTPPGTPPGGTPGKGAETKTPPGTPPGTTPPGATGPTGSAADLVPVLEAATAIILSPGGHGSGFFIGRNMVVTNRHVVKEPYPGNKVYLASRKFGTVLEGTVIAAAGTGQAGGSDFAVIRVDDQVPAHIKPLPLAAEPASLKQVVAAGYPGAVVRNDRNFIDLIKGDPSKAPELVLTRGEISAVQNRERGIPSVAHTAAISSGNSGGPLVDSCGRVVGINTFGTKAEAGPGGGFALGSTGIANFLKSSDVPFDWQEVACAK